MSRGRGCEAGQTNGIPEHGFFVIPLVALNRVTIVESAHILIETAFLPQEHPSTSYPLAVLRRQ